MKYLSLVLITFLCLNTLNAQDLSKKEKKEAAKVEAYNDLKSLIESNNYRFIAEWSMPTGSARRNLMSTPNSLDYDGNEMDVMLPYFGSSQTVNTYNHDSMGIEFKGKPEKYNIKYNDDKREIEITFQGKYSSESLNFKFVIKGTSARLYVNSSGRNSISYDGKISELKKEE
ncbi:DUF4251 domain-containing protein [Flavobacteriaceae bacterium]|nr:DUF4251 domain-containing protein [Flavobacteriaceae bacterium]